MKNFIYILFISAISLTLSNASFAQQDNRWIYVTGSDDIDVYIDKLSVVCDNSNNYTVWIKQVCKSYCDGVKEAKIRIKYFVGSNQYQHLSLIFFHTDGTNYKENGKDYSREDIVPDSLIEGIYDYILGNYSCK